MEAFGDAVGARETPHAHDGLDPVFQGGRQRFGGAVLELSDQGQESGQQTLGQSLI